jgi:hypothetical protein
LAEISAKALIIDRVMLGGAAFLAVGHGLTPSLGAPRDLKNAKRPARRSLKRLC